MAEKLLLIDANALLYRAHFALIRSPRFNKKGVNTSALFGFTNTLISLWLKQKPTHIIVALDPKGRTWRSEAYAPYKAQRQAQPENITAAITLLPKLLEAFQIPLIQKEGYEADDVIGTLAVQAAAEGVTVYMVTPDKDFAQLVSENIHWYKPGIGGKNDLIMDLPRVLREWCIQQPKQVQDILGLWGDSSDNIPGIPGIGQKNAQKLIASFQSIENILRNKEGLTARQRTLFTQYGEQALLSKKLATICTDVPLDFSLEGAAHRGIDRKKIKTLFTELDFHTLAKRILEPSTLSTAQLELFNAPNKVRQPAEQSHHLATLATTKHKYRCLDTIEACKALADRLAKQKVFAFDTETSSLQPRYAELFGIALAHEAHEAYYIPLSNYAPLDRDNILNCFRPLFQNPNIKKIGHNLKYDLHVLQRHYSCIRGPFFDTMVAHHLLHPERRHGLNIIAEHYLQYRPIPIDTLIGPPGPKQKKITAVPLAQLTDYACEDADVTLQLYQKLSLQLDEENLSSLFHEVEMPLLPVLLAMETAGVTIDAEALNQSSQLLQTEINKLAETIHNLAQENFNIGSPKQLGAILFDKLQITKNPTKTKTGQYATHEGVLSKLENKHPIIKEIKTYRELQKLKSTYIDALLSLIDPVNGRVHTSYQQTIVSTGRLSSAKPNLQNIPIRTHKGRTIRQAFVPREKGGYLLSADYSQIELRIIAHLSGDENLIETFKRGEDMHRTTASKLFKVPQNAVTEPQRGIAKITNFGIVYGITSFGLSQRLNISRTEAQEIINNYFLTFPGVKKYIDASIAKARKQGWVRTMLGRKRFLPDINSRNITVREFAERNAINMPIQGTQAEMIKKAMISIHQWLQDNSLKSKIIMQVYDELILDIHPEELSPVQEQVPRLMEEALPLSLPVVVKVKTGKNWLQAH